MRTFLAWLAAALAWSGAAAERTFNFAELAEGQKPPGFHSLVSGQGSPGDWHIVLEEMPSPLPSVSQHPGARNYHAVLAQTARDPTDNHYPLLVFDDEIFADFTLTTRFKLVGGTNEQMAGVAFRIQDEKNYYYVRASGLGNTFYFFRFVNGDLIGPIGSKVEISRNTWHEMTVECLGSQVTCSLDGKVIIPRLIQDAFPKGKVGFWTKSDSVSYFADTKIVYKPVVPSVQRVVDETVKKYSRLLGVKLYAPGTNTEPPRVVASKEKADLGQAGGTTERDVLAQGTAYYGKGDGDVSVIMPVRDRNGEIVAAVRLRLKSFPGQTEENALARARPIVKDIEERILPLKDLND